MTKREFLAELRSKLSGMSQADVEERLLFYGEMIDDRMEEGLSEEAAVASIGSADRIAAQLAAENPGVVVVKETAGSGRELSWWEITLLVLGSPVWVSLLFAAVSVAFGVYITLWSVIISLWAVFVSLAACGVALVIGGIVLAGIGRVLAGAALVGAGFVCAGLAIFWFFGSHAATKGSVLLTKKIVQWIKGCFGKKENTK